MTLITIITFWPDGDWVKAIFIDGELFRYGDEYHDKISTYIDGFIDGFKASKIPVNVRRGECIDYELEDSIVLDGGSPPKTMYKIKTKYE